MTSIIYTPPVDISVTDSQDSLFPSFLWLNPKITYKHKGQYRKGFLVKQDGIYNFSFKSHFNKHKEEWSVPLPNLAITWANMCTEGILLPVHISHTFFDPRSLQKNWCLIWLFICEHSKSSSQLSSNSCEGPCRLSSWLQHLIMLAKMKRNVAPSPFTLIKRLLRGSIGLSGRKEPNVPSWWCVSWWLKKMKTCSLFRQSLALMS